MVKIPASNAGYAGLIPGQGTKIPLASHCTPQNETHLAKAGVVMGLRQCTQADQPEKDLRNPGSAGWSPHLQAVRSAWANIEHACR